MNQRIATAVRKAKTRLSSQAIADLALFEDQARRDALKRGDRDSAKIHDAEVRRLARVMNRSY